MKLKSTVALLLLAQILAFTSDYQNKTEYYYNLTKMKDATPPREVEMVKIDNLSRGTSVVKRGVLFTYKNRNAHAVYIAGNFSQWQTIPMQKNTHGLWYFFLEEYSTEKDLEYKFQVNGIWVADPLNSMRRDDGYGSYTSLSEPAFSSLGKNVTFRKIDGRTIEFRLYRPNARMISLVGDFNNWNPEADLLEKGDDNIWRLVKRISPGTYRYKYVVDGKWMADVYNNESCSDQTGEICSMVYIR
ncbi:MAG TPA: glycogen-binding domain-containing protein [Spirochaetota bacterium]|nr:glycogen-binding domain-containing protein [Spirochaetota bacterium]HPI89524.1 glycogen-binding domain-containing protein [Spirochaetota bacterium]HPR47112.1 glycogen-binding domain-containing protein [Spirochaetota bacterium]